MTPFILLVFGASILGTFGFGIAYVGARRRALRAEAALAARSEPTQTAELIRAIDAVAIEVERLGEGQRYLTRVVREKGESAKRASGT